MDRRSRPAADVVITMGCGDACPLSLASATKTGNSDDPTGKTIEEIRPIRDEIERRVRHLLANSTPPLAHEPAHGQRMTPCFCVAGRVEVQNQ
jgi:hypothetical protein